MKDGGRNGIFALLLAIVVLAAIVGLTNFSLLSGDRVTGTFDYGGALVTYDLPKAEVLEGARNTETRTAVVNEDTGLVRSRNTRIVTNSACDSVSADVRVCLDFPEGVRTASVRVAGSAEHTKSKSRTSCGWTWPTSTDVDNPDENLPCMVEGGEVLLTYERVGDAYRVTDGTKSVVVDDLNDQCFTAFAQTYECTSSTAVAEIQLKELSIIGDTAEDITMLVYVIGAVLLVAIAFLWRLTR